ncbi:Hypothetical predicted protein [Mytilus galloprovincialis]|uniref:Transmembrane protein n=1 Tax=Mytilus galloprovincialis TaxID=29158 RepID=A0A8B6BS18_MYTGA|nr:Hypothetical predicted protein [Mytilus galloprovincialis]
MTSRQESIEDNGTTHIMLKTSTIYSSLNSIYNNKDFPLKVMKIFTSAILVAMTIAILTVTSNIYHSKSSKTSDCIKLSSLGLDVDQSKNLTCQYKKKVDLPENEIMSTQRGLVTIKDGENLLRVTGSFGSSKTAQINNYRGVTYIHLKSPAGKTGSSAWKTFTMSFAEYCDLVRMVNVEELTELCEQFQKQNRVQMKEEEAALRLLEEKRREPPRKRVRKVPARAFPIEDSSSHTD